MLATIDTGRATASVLDALCVPHSRASRNPVVYCHGVGLTAAQVKDLTTNIEPIVRKIVDGGNYALGATTVGTGWGNSTARSRLTDVVALLRTSTGGASSTRKAVLVGASMGSVTALAWANANPTLVACLVLILPCYDLQTVRDANTLSLQAGIDGAYGTSGTLPAGSSPLSFASAISSIPIYSAYATDDAVSVNHATFESSHGNVTTYSLGANGHTATSIGLVDTAAVLNFVNQKAAAA